MTFRTIASLKSHSLPTDGFSAGKGTYQNAIPNKLATGFTRSSGFHRLTATKTGRRAFGPVTGNIVRRAASSNRGGDPFFRQFFNTGEQKQVTLATETLNVESLPLPARVYRRIFNGAVGDYTMTVTAGPTNVAVGDPSTVRVQISGHGALDALTLPDQPAWRDSRPIRPRRTLKQRTSSGLKA